MVKAAVMFLNIEIMSLRFGPKKIKKWLENGIDVYAYFNNDVAGFAVENAKTLAKMVSS